MLDDKVVVAKKNKKALLFRQKELSLQNGKHLL